MFSAFLQDCSADLFTDPPEADRASGFFTVIPYQDALKNRIREEPGLNGPDFACKTHISAFSPAVPLRCRIYAKLQ